MVENLFSLTNPFLFLWGRAGCFLRDLRKVFFPPTFFFLFPFFRSFRVVGESFLPSSLAPAFVYDGKIFLFVSDPFSLPPFPEVDMKRADPCFGLPPLSPDPGPNPPFPKGEFFLTTVLPVSVLVSPSRIFLVVSFLHLATSHFVPFESLSLHFWPSVHWCGGSLFSETSPFNIPFFFFFFETFSFFPGGFLSYLFHYVLPADHF